MSSKTTPVQTHRFSRPKTGRRSPLLRSLRKLLKQHGLDLIDATTTGSGHWKLAVAGVPGPYYTAATPSDYRGMRNLVADLRRLREAA